MRKMLLGLLVAAVTAVGGPPAHAQELKKFTFILDFLPYGEYTPYFTALARGWFKEEGLNAEILRGAGSADTVKRIAAGQGHAGSADFGAIVAAIANEDVKIRAISTYYRLNSNSIFVRADSGIKGIKDLVGKKIAITPGNSHIVLWPIVAANVGIPADSVNWVTMDGAAMGPALISKQVDAAPFGAHHEARLQKQSMEMANISLNRFLYADHGLDAYSLSLFATDDSIKANGPEIKKFIKALNRGIDHCFAKGNHEECAKHVMDANSVVEKVAAEGASKVAATFVYTPDIKAGKAAIGQFDPARVKSSQDVFEKYLKLKKTVPIADLYTNDLLPERK